MTTPVNVRSATLLLDHEAARANTAWTAMYLQIRSRQKAILDQAKKPNVRCLQALDVEALEHNLGRVLPVLGSVERRLGLMLPIRQLKGKMEDGSGMEEWEGDVRSREK
jgi:hypothetical protein